MLEIYKDPKVIFELSEKELLGAKSIGKKTVKEIIDSKNNTLIEKHIKFMEKNYIDIISINEKEYPKNLKEIYDPPISLYIKGNKKILNEKNIAIVGCREASNYGINAAKYFAYNLSKEKVNIVSGLAKGIDSFAHIGSLIAYNEKKMNCGKTIAVLGNGIDFIYPQENVEIAKKILKSDGAIISEYPLGSKPNKINFPARNRIISGISKSIIVIEAKERSGTLITVDFALEQGRDVFVVPRKY